MMIPGHASHASKLWRRHRRLTAASEEHNERNKRCGDDHAEADQNSIR
jgi:hypothetical protein